MVQAPCASGSKTLLSSSASQQDIEAGDEQRSRKQKVGCSLAPLRQPPTPHAISSACGHGRQQAPPVRRMQGCLW